MEETAQAGTLQTTEHPNKIHAWYVVSVLVLAYTVSFIDRTILTLLIEPVRAALDITDTEISLLYGIAFAIFYTVLGIPIAWFADRKNRTVIISIGIFIWSLMTALCGLAQSFWQMFLARVGVGIGQAALSPAAYSMIADYFEPEKLSRALSVYTTGLFIGSGLALMLGGVIISVTPAMTLPVIGPMEPWQMVFIIVGLPGLLVVALMVTVREPARRGLAAKVARPASDGDAQPGLGRELGETVCFIWSQRRTYFYHFFGFSAFAFIWMGTSSWIPTYFIRTHGWSVGEVGFNYGLVVLVLGSAGIISGGYVASWMKQKGYQDADMRTGIIAAVCVLPFGVIAPLMANDWAALVLFAGLTFFTSFPWGAAAAALQVITPNRMRAMVSALYLFVLNLAAIGCGPTVVALITDQVFEDIYALKYSLSISVAVAAPITALILWKSLASYRESVAKAETYQLAQ